MTIVSYYRYVPPLLDPNIAVITYYDPVMVNGRKTFPGNIDGVGFDDINNELYQETRNLNRRASTYPLKSYCRRSLIRLEDNTLCW